MTLDIAQIEQLMKALAQYGLSELILEQENFSLKLRRNIAGEVAETPAPVPEAPPVKPAAAPEEPRGTVVRAPIVGTFYPCPTPDAAPFVRVGDTVRQGDVLFIIESMKLMNEVTSEVSGTVREVLAQSGDPVEYGQPLMRID